MFSWDAVYSGASVFSLALQCSDQVVDLLEIKSNIDDDGLAGIASRSDWGVVAVEQLPHQSCLVTSPVCIHPAHTQIHTHDCLQCQLTDNDDGAHCCVKTPALTIRMYTLAEPILTLHGRHKPRWHRHRLHTGSGKNAPDGTTGKKVSLRHRIKRQDVFLLGVLEMPSVIRWIRHFAPVSGLRGSAEQCNNRDDVRLQLICVHASQTNTYSRRHSKWQLLHCSLIQL